MWAPAAALSLLMAQGACKGGTTRFPNAGSTHAVFEAGEPKQGTQAPILEVLERELKTNLARLSAEDIETPAYFIAYDLVTLDELWVQASDGAIMKSSLDSERVVDVDIHVGDPFLDNSRAQEGDYYGRGLGSGAGTTLDDNDLSLSQSLWLITESQFRAASDAYSNVLTLESMVTREGEEEHPDFSQEEPLVYFEPVATADLRGIAERWEPITREASLVIADDPAIFASQVVLQGTVENHDFVNSEGTKVHTGRVRLRLMLSVATQAPDGMELSRFASFEAHQDSELPNKDEVLATAKRLRDELLALRSAPLAEPYTGPAVLDGRAAGVFFHEIFGHRLEGHRQKDLAEGQTFTKMLGGPVLPEFLDVVDDPTIARLDGHPLSGHYFIDDEGVRAQPAVLVQGGVLMGFLLGRSPVLPFEVSNGHGRREPGNPIVARQGNLIITSKRALPQEQLRKALVDEAKKQGKPYGLWFEDIQGGYTITDRSGPQAFKVMPLMVYRVFADGRPDELVRGADIVGTPLAAFETIMATGDTLGIFNGMCGAESGWVPVSAVSPAILLSKLEIERAANERAKPPLLPAPRLDHGMHRRGASPALRSPPDHPGSSARGGTIEHTSLPGTASKTAQTDTRGGAR